MFYETKIEILQSPEDIPIKTIDADVQPYSGSVDFDYGLSLELSKRVFCDADTEISEELYCRIDTVYYKILDIKGWRDHMEIFLYECKRQVV
ncbi:MAG TPA: hypothetical protein DD730_07770 [Desulfosporosinus sp.]|jgi:hypothetical protein|nr:hypothetical protein [Desulfosporosinus sp.]